MDERLLGRYRVQSLLGRGAFATVHEAHDEQLDDQVAIKLLAHNHALDADMRQRFVAEGQLLRRISSPHVIDVHDLAESADGRPFLVLELCDRGTLRERVEEARGSGWQPTDADAVALAVPLTAAIQAFTDAEVVHRDLTPANILLTSGGRSESESVQSTLIRPGERLVVTDLGFCKDLARSTGITAAGGTSGFQPPEQRTPGGSVDARSDIWAASSVITWAITGATVETAEEARSALRDAGLSSAMGAAIAAGLAREQAKRPATPATWLAQILAAAPAGVAVNPGAAGLAAGPGPSSVNRSAAISAAVVVVLAVAMASMVSGRAEIPDQANRPFGTEALEDPHDQNSVPTPIPIAVPTPTSTPTRPPPTIDPDELAYGYGPALEGEWSFHVRTYEGWEYDVQIQGRAAIAFRVFEPSTAPPGKGHIESATIGGLTQTVTPTVEGKEAPSLSMWIEPAFVGEDPPVNTGQCQSYEEMNAGPTLNLHCDLPQGGMRTEAVWHAFGLLESDVDVVQARIAPFTDRAPDLFYVELPREKCDVVLLPDGRVGVDVPTSSERRFACTITGPDTFAYEPDA